MENDPEHENGIALEVVDVRFTSEDGEILYQSAYKDGSVGPYVRSGHTTSEPGIIPKLREDLLSRE